MYLIFTHVFGESYCRRFSFFMCSCDICGVLGNSVYWFKYCRVTVGDSGLWCVHMTSFECWVTQFVCWFKYCRVTVGDKRREITKGNTQFCKYLVLPPLVCVCVCVCARARMHACVHTWACTHKFRNRKIESIWCFSFSCQVWNKFENKSIDLLSQGLCTGTSNCWPCW